MNRRELSHITPEVYTEQADHAYRLDGNNVDIDTEEVELASEQLRYQLLADSVTQEFSRMKTAIGP